MISCNFSGQLGNNLFQLANIFAIHKRNDFELVLPSNIKSEISKLLDNTFTYTENIRLPEYNHWDLNSQFTDFSFKSVPNFDNVCYNGYFQSEKYFDWVNIPDEFHLNKSAVEYVNNKYRELLTKKCISLHLRFYEESEQLYHPTVKFEYYSRSLSLIQDLNLNDFNILVFSNKINLAKQYLGKLPYNLIYVTDGDYISDFILMTLCSINIIGNSTFSWWAAYLNNNKIQEPFVPATEWFGPGYSHYNLKDLFPQKWTKI